MIFNENGVILNEFKIDPTLPIKSTKHIIKKYSKLLPKEILKLYTESGLGYLCNRNECIMDGYFQLIDPDKYISILNKVNDNNSCIPIILTAFGDIIYYNKDDDYIHLFNSRYKKDSYIGKSKFFCDDIRNSEPFKKDFFEEEFYKTLVNKLGYLKYGKIYGYEPALIFGGSENIDNIKIFDAIEHLNIILQL